MGAFNQHRSRQTLFSQPLFSRSVPLSLGLLISAQVLLTLMQPGHQARTLRREQCGKASWRSDPCLPTDSSMHIHECILFALLPQPPLTSLHLSHPLPPLSRTLFHVHTFRFCFGTLIEPDYVCGHWTQNYSRKPDEPAISYPGEGDSCPSLPWIPSVAKSSLRSGKDPQSFLGRKPRPRENATCTLSRVNTGFQPLPYVFNLKQLLKLCNQSETIEGEH